MKDYAELIDMDPFTDDRRKIEIQSRLSRPYAESNPDDALKERYVSVDLSASDEQLIRDFASWLKAVRSKDDLSPPERLFTDRDFVDWYKSGILPYFDLRVISQIEGLDVPLHVIGDALFPEDIGVDVAERVRKVTQRKVNRIFQDDVIEALRLQAESER